MKHSSEKNAVSKLDDTSYKSNSKMNKKEIDWEERHFQICLAMLSCPVSDSVGMTKAPVPGDIIARADRMIDLLKQKYADETASHESITNDGTELESKSDSKSAQKPAKRLPLLGATHTTIRTILKDLEGTANARFFTRR